MAAVHIHDCDGCVYLRTKEYNGKVYDLYECVGRLSSGRLITTYVARYSSDGPDYLSETPEYNLGGKVLQFSTMKALFS